VDKASVLAPGDHRPVSASLEKTYAGAPALPVDDVTFVAVAAPIFGVVRTGDVARTTAPLPVEVVPPVPPLATAKVPASVIVPDVVIGPPEVVRPVEPPLTATLVTVPVKASLEAMLKLGYVPVIVVVPLPVSETVWSGAVLAIVIDPSPLVTLMPVLAVIVALASEPSEVLPIRSCPSV
jgi:hypothetical protein